MLRRIVASCIAATVGCGGPSTEEWQAAQSNLTKLKADLEVANKRHEEDERKYKEAMTDIDGLKTKLATVVEQYNDAVQATAEQQQQIEALSRYHQAAAAPPPADPNGWHQVWAGTIRGEDHCQLVIATTFEPSAALGHVAVRRAFIRRTYSSKAGCPKEKWRVDVGQIDFDCVARTWIPIAATVLDWNENQTSNDFSDVTAPQAVFQTRSWNRSGSTSAARSRAKAAARAQGSR